MPRPDVNAPRVPRAAETGGQNIDVIVEALVEAIVGQSGTADPGAVLELEAHLARLQGRQAARPAPAESAPIDTEAAVRPAPVPLRPASMPPAPLPVEPDPLTGEPDPLVAFDYVPKPVPAKTGTIHPIEARFKKLDRRLRLNDEAAVATPPEPAPALPAGPEELPRAQGVRQSGPVRVTAPVDFGGVRPGADGTQAYSQALPSGAAFSPGRGRGQEDDDVFDDLPDDGMDLFEPAPADRRLVRLLFAAGLVVFAFMSVPVLVRVFAPGSAGPGLVAAGTTGDGTSK